MQIAEFEHSLALLRDGDPGRPLLVPWDDAVRQDFAVVQLDWSRFREWSVPPQSEAMEALRADTAAFAAHIDTLVAAIETHMSRWTALLHLLADRDDGFGRSWHRATALHRLPVRAGAGRTA